LASRAQRLYDQLDAVQTLRRAAKHEMLAESQKSGAYRLLAREQMTVPHPYANC